MYIIFDTETTGLPKDWNAPITDVDNWPRCIQIAWQLHDEMGNLVEHEDYLIKPDGFVKQQLQLGSKDLVWKVVRTREMGSEKIMLGSLVITNSKKIFISIGVGKLILDDEEFLVVAPGSPLGKQLMGLKVNDETMFNKERLTILQIG